MHNYPATLVCPLSLGVVICKGCLINKWVKYKHVAIDVWVEHRNVSIMYGSNRYRYGAIDVWVKYKHISLDVRIK